MPDEKTKLIQETGLALDEESTEAKPRVKIEFEEPEDRIKDFREVEKGFSAEEAHFEAKRCLRCDLEKEKSRLMIRSITQPKTIEEIEQLLTAPEEFLSSDAEPA